MQHVGSLINFKIFIIRKLSFLIAYQYIGPKQYFAHIQA